MGLQSAQYLIIHDIYGSRTCLRGESGKMGVIQAGRCDLL
jgi:hypothetical protein